MKEPMKQEGVLTAHRDITDVAVISISISDESNCDGCTSGDGRG